MDSSAPAPWQQPGDSTPSVFWRLDISSFWSSFWAAVMKTLLLQTMLGRGLSGLVTSSAFLSTCLMLLPRLPSADGLYRVSNSQPHKERIQLLKIVNLLPAG